MRWLVLVVVGVMLSAVPARADVMNGKELQGFCMPHQASNFDMGTCLGYITGIADAIHRSTVDIYGWRVCMGDEVTVERMHDAVINFLNANPQYLDLDADSLVARALSDAFPCT
ncbi:MAG: Rap1a/Tai family immunity protein [Pseudomonadota bacterium]